MLRFADQDKRKSKCILV